MTLRARIAEARTFYARGRAVWGLLATLPPRNRNVLVEAQELVPGDRIVIGRAVVTLDVVEETFAGVMFICWGGALDCQFVCGVAKLELVR